MEDLEEGEMQKIRTKNENSSYFCKYVDSTSQPAQIDCSTSSSCDTAYCKKQTSEKYPKFNRSERHRSMELEANASQLSSVPISMRSTSDRLHKNDQTNQHSESSQVHKFTVNGDVETMTHDTASSSKEVSSEAESRTQVESPNRGNERASFYSPSSSSSSSLTSDETSTYSPGSERKVESDSSMQSSSSRSSCSRSICSSSEKCKERAKNGSSRSSSEKNTCNIDNNHDFDNQANYRHETADKIRCYCTNIQSLINKRAELEVVVNEKKPHIIGITESWCNQSILDSEVAIEGYSMFRLDKDTVTGKGGGVILYVDNSMSAVTCHEIQNHNFESSVWCVIKLERNENLLVGLCYRSPNDSTEENNNKLLDQMKHTAKVHNVTHLLVIGDFNFSEINWKDGSIKGGAESPPQKFYDVVQDLFLVQHVVKRRAVLGRAIFGTSYFWDSWSSGLVSRLWCSRSQDQYSAGPL